MFVMTNYAKNYACKIYETLSALKCCTDPILYVIFRVHFRDRRGAATLRLKKIPSPYRRQVSSIG